LNARKKRGPVVTTKEKELDRADRYYFRGVTIVFLCVIPLVISLGFDLAAWITYTILSVGAVGLAHVFIGSYLKSVAEQE
jgi:hypothetical protein